MPKAFSDEIKRRALELVPEHDLREVADILGGEFPHEPVSHGTIGNWAKQAGIEPSGTPGRVAGVQYSKNRDEALRLRALKWKPAAIARRLHITRQAVSQLLKS